MGSKLDDSVTCSTAVGPGQYDIQRKPMSGPAYSIAGKQGLTQMDKMTTPGPGQYAPEIKVIQECAPAYTFAGGNPQNGKEAEGNPAPGDYNTEDKREKGPAFSLGIKRDTHKSNSDTPGDCMPWNAAFGIQK